jgi:hypothetical protein
MNDGREELSDGQILSELGQLKDMIIASRREAADQFARMLAKDLYAADERTRELHHKHVDGRLDDLGIDVVNLQAEATRKDKERRRFWGLLTVTMCGVVGTGLLAWSTALHTSRVVCVPAPSSTQIVCQVVR